MMRGSVPGKIREAGWQFGLPLRSFVFIVAGLFTTVSAFVLLAQVSFYVGLTASLVVMCIFAVVVFFRTPNGDTFENPLFSWVGFRHRETYLVRGGTARIRGASGTFELRFNGARLMENLTPRDKRIIWQRALMDFVQTGQKRTAWDYRQMYLFSENTPWLATRVPCLSKT
jgi:hypothetical protein